MMAAAEAQMMDISAEGKSSVMQIAARAESLHEMITAKATINATKYYLYFRAMKKMSFTSLFQIFL